MRNSQLESCVICIHGRKGRYRDDAQIDTIDNMPEF
jgi:hypothetical protein